MFPRVHDRGAYLVRTLPLTACPITHHPAFIWLTVLYIFDIHSYTDDQPLQEDLDLIADGVKKHNALH